MNYIEELFSLKNKIIIVTGASRGIGFEIATGFSKAGATVIGVGRTENIETKDFDYYPIDIRDQNKITELCKLLYKKYKQINVLFNSVGISSSPYSDKDSNEDFLEILETNLIAIYKRCNVVSSFMNAGDAIINITSIGAKLAFPNNPGYLASKGGLAALTRSLAYDLSKNNIRVNNIVPGYIHTQMTKESFENNNLRVQRENRMLIKRWGETTDLVGAAIYLASDASSYVTGTDIYVDGGWSVKGL